jgi:hypothetical protein
MACVVTFYQLPEEVPSFLAYLRNSGDVWARAVHDEPQATQFEPLPVTDFLNRFGERLVKYHAVDVYLGLREDILAPQFAAFEETVGGALEPYVQDGAVVPDVQTIVGGRKVLRTHIDFMASSLVRYDQGQYHDDRMLTESNLCFYAGNYRGQEWVNKPAGFLTWVKNVLSWMRRHTSEAVPSQGRPVTMRATVGVVAAHRNGLRPA